MNDYFLPRNNIDAYNWIKSFYNGILVVSDVHGNYDSLRKMVDYSNKHKLFCIFLGDIVDYGNNNKDCIILVDMLIKIRKAICIIGNHEKKCYAVIKDLINFGSTRKNISLALQKTLDERVSGNKNWDNTFFHMVENSPNWQEIGNMIFTHGAVHSNMWGNENFRARKNSIEENFSFYGETSGNYVDNFPERTYIWTDKIPDEKVAVVGHDIRSFSAPYITQNKKAIFLDTGSSKSKIIDNVERIGFLSGARFNFTNTSFSEVEFVR